MELRSSVRVRLQVFLTNKTKCWFCFIRALVYQIFYGTPLITGNLIRGSIRVLSLLRSSVILVTVTPELAKPHSGLSSDRCSAARESDEFMISEYCFPTM